MMNRKAMIIPDASLVAANNFGLGMDYGQRMFTEELVKISDGSKWWANSASVKPSFDDMIYAAAFSPEYIPDPLNTEKSNPETGPKWADYDLDKTRIAALLAAMVHSVSVPDVEGVAKPQFEELLAANGFERAEVLLP